MFLLNFHNLYITELFIQYKYSKAENSPALLTQPVIPNMDWSPTCDVTVLTQTPATSFTHTHAHMHTHKHTNKTSGLFSIQKPFSRK